jgi:hypothetical protein
VDFRAAHGFGGDPYATGITGTTPRPGRAAVTRDLAEKLSLHPGSEILVFANGGRVRLAVDRVLPRRGVAGFWTIDTRQQSYNVLVAPGTIAALVASAPSGSNAEPPRTVVAVSNTGSVEGGAARTTAAGWAHSRRGPNP